ncbi:hypothetical protein JCM8097_002330 [Rhodosporidiobolus ruineniae]
MAALPSFRNFLSNLLPTSALPTPEVSFSALGAVEVQLTPPSSPPSSPSLGQTTLLAAPMRSVPSSPVLRAAKKLGSRVEVPCTSTLLKPARSTSSTTVDEERIGSWTASSPSRHFYARRMKA